MNRPGGFVSVLSIVLRLALGGLFVFAGVMKLLKPQDFSEAIVAFKILTPEEHGHVIRMLTFGLPWLEVLAGLAVLIGFWTRASAATLAAMSAVFVAGLFSVVHRGMSTSCTCFGDMDLFCTGPISLCHVYRTGGFAVAGLLIWALGGGRWAVERIWTKEPEPIVPESLSALADLED